MPQHLETLAALCDQKRRDTPEPFTGLFFFALFQTRIDISFISAVRRLTAARDDPLSAPSPGGSSP